MVNIPKFTIKINHSCRQIYQSHGEINFTSQNPVTCASLARFPYNFHVRFRRCNVVRHSWCRKKLLPQKEPPKRLECSKKNPGKKFRFQNFQGAQGFLGWYWKVWFICFKMKKKRMKPNKTLHMCFFVGSRVR